MKDWLFSGKDYVCDLRVAGVLVRDGKMLVQRECSGHEFAIPGGHVKIGEMMSDSLMREFREETGADIVLKRILWTEECFWEYQGRKVHSITFYYLIELSDDSDVPDNGKMIPQKDNPDILLGWMPVERLGDITIYPAFIREEIHHLEKEIRHFVTYA
ncbi:MAG: NUDIX domain-containing protein [Clostridia bacterium]|nr:NUDIX domain-containing protein [Clostridia bacterium]